jgi:hypothetical protein
MSIMEQAMKTFVCAAMVLMVGCQSAREEVYVAPPAPASVDVLADLKLKLSATSPGVEVAAVTEVNADTALLAGGVTTATFPESAVVTIVDSAGNLVGHGTVIAPAGDGVMIRHANTVRPPVRGDVVVRF